MNKSEFNNLRKSSPPNWPSKLACRDNETLIKAIRSTAAFLSWNWAIAIPIGSHKTALRHNEKVRYIDILWDYVLMPRKPHSTLGNPRSVHSSPSRSLQSTTDSEMEQEAQVKENKITWALIAFILAVPLFCAGPRPVQVCLTVWAKWFWLLRCLLRLFGNKSTCIWRSEPKKKPFVAGSTKTICWNSSKTCTRTVGERSGRDIPIVEY